MQTATLLPAKEKKKVDVFEKGHEGRGIMPSWASPYQQSWT